jgi:hypothetical protein
MEFEKGWSRARSVYSAAAGQANNAHRLLLFYAVENGLKAFIMKAERLSDGSEGFDVEVHDVNKLLARAGAQKSLLLPTNVRIKGSYGGSARNCATGQINQMWRYGCVAENPTDAELELGLQKVATWIEENI